MSARATGHASPLDRTAFMVARGESLRTISRRLRVDQRTTYRYLAIIEARGVAPIDQYQVPQEIRDRMRGVRKSPKRALQAKEKRAARDSARWARKAPTLRTCLCGEAAHLHRNGKWRCAKTGCVCVEFYERGI